LLIALHVFVIPLLFFLSIFLSFLFYNFRFNSLLLIMFGQPALMGGV